MFVNGIKIHKFTAKDPEIVPNNLYFGNVSKDFFASNMKKTGFNGYIYDCSVDYDSIAVDDILDIHKYLMNKMLRLVKQIFVPAIMFFGCNLSSANSLESKTRNC